jgi:hypothetical protein
VYVSKVDDQVLHFAVSGALWNRSLVMMDSQTKSLWSHLLGEAMDGKLKGKTLEVIPSHLTDWETWQKVNPKTTVVKLSRTSKNYRNEFYKDKTRFIVGIAGGGQAKAWSFAKLDKQQVINDEFADQPIAVFFEPESKTALTFSRELDGKVLSFSADGDTIIDAGTRTTWNRLTGRAIAGPLKGRSLEPVVSIVSYRRAWMIFHPGTTGLK